MNKYSQKGSHTIEESRTFRLGLTRLESVLFENESRSLNDFVDNRDVSADWRRRLKTL